MPAIVNRKRKVTATLQTGLEKTCAQLKVRVVYGKAELVSAKLVRVTTAEGMEEVESDNVIIATGSSPLELPALPVDHARVLSSDDALELQAVPASLIIVGGRGHRLRAGVHLPGVRLQGDGRGRPKPRAAPALRGRRNQPSVAARNEKEGHRRGTGPHGDRHNAHRDRRLRGDRRVSVRGGGQPARPAHA